MSEAALKIGAVMYPGFEMLDMFGPLEMLSMLGPDVVEIVMLAETREPVPTAMGEDIERGPRVAVDATFDDGDFLGGVFRNLFVDVPGSLGAPLWITRLALLELILHGWLSIADIVGFVVIAHQKSLKPETLFSFCPLLQPLDNILHGHRPGTFYHYPVICNELFHKCL